MADLFRRRDKPPTESRPPYEEMVKTVNGAGEVNDDDPVAKWLSQARVTELLHPKEKPKKGQKAR